MFVLKRHLIDEDGDEFISYLTTNGEYGTRDEAYVFEDYDEAAEERDKENMYYHYEFPFDSNDFDVVEFD